MFLEEIENESSTYVDPYAFFEIEEDVDEVEEDGYNEEDPV